MTTRSTPRGPRWTTRAARAARPPGGPTCPRRCTEARVAPRPCTWTRPAAQRCSLKAPRPRPVVRQGPRDPGSPLYLRHAGSASTMNVKKKLKLPMTCVAVSLCNVRLQPLPGSTSWDSRCFLVLLGLIETELSIKCGSVKLDYTCCIIATALYSV